MPLYMNYITVLTQQPFEFIGAYFTDGKTDALGGQIICPMPHKY